MWFQRVRVHACESRQGSRQACHWSSSQGLAHILIHKEDTEVTEGEWPKLSNLKACTSNSTPPSTRPDLLILPKQFQLWAKYSNIGANGDCFLSNHHPQLLVFFFFLCCFFFNCCYLFSRQRHKFDSDCFVWLLPPTHFRQGKGRGTKGSPWGRWRGRGSEGGSGRWYIRTEECRDSRRQHMRQKEAGGSQCGSSLKVTWVLWGGCWMCRFGGTGLSLHFSNKLPGDVKALWEKVLITTIRIRQKDLLKELPWWLGHISKSKNCWEYNREVRSPKGPAELESSDYQWRTKETKINAKQCWLAQLGFSRENVRNLFLDQE